MKYYVKQRRPNYIDFGPDSCEEGKINSLNDIFDFEFMTFHRLRGETMFLLTNAEVPDRIEPHWNVYVYDPTEIHSFKDCIWVARLYEIEDD